MFSFLFTNSDNYKKTNFEDMQYALTHSKEFIIINTLSAGEQSVLITGTIDALSEEKIVNEMIHNIDTPDKKVMIYGKNANDDSPHKKYKQLRNLGITDISIYSGGLFEWLLLQDIYGFKTFPTTSKIMDILKYK
jgi:hypothetical protein